MPWQCGDDSEGAERNAAGEDNDNMFGDVARVAACGATGIGIFDVVGVVGVVSVAGTLARCGLDVCT